MVDLLGGALPHHCPLKALDIEVSIMMRAAITSFVFCVSVSFCKNARFLAISFSMIEITCCYMSMTSALSASDQAFISRALTKRQHAHPSCNASCAMWAEVVTNLGEDIESILRIGNTSFIRTETAKGRLQIITANRWWWTPGLTRKRI